MDEQAYAAERKRMVKEQIARRGLDDPRLLAAFRRVPRHRFVPEKLRGLAYDDGPLPIGHGQTISQPYIVALMTDMLHLTGEERVLEVGTGSGYQAAILACLAKQVHTIEFVPELAQHAQESLQELGFDGVCLHVGDGSLGWPDAAPYDGIIVTAAAPAAPETLLDQLSDGGRLVLPVGGRGFQELEYWQRRGEDYQSRVITGVAFVPLRGEHGWDREGW
jgi:protein-L-isoaspartate(D-aspartate) O-methyltransferase